MKYEVLGKVLYVALVILWYDYQSRLDLAVDAWRHNHALLL